MPNGAWPSAFICSRHSGRMSHLADRDAERAASGRGRCPSCGSWCRSRASCSAWIAVARHAEVVHRLADDEQRQRRIEPAGDADGDRRLADVLQPLGQAGDLRVEDLVAALVAACAGPGGTNGWASTCAQQCRLARRRVRDRTRRGGTSRAPMQRLRVAEAVRPHAVVREGGRGRRRRRAGARRGGSARDSASRVPFSAIRQCPPKTRSVVDSPTPHDA